MNTKKFYYLIIMSIGLQNSITTSEEVIDSSNHFYIIYEDSPENQHYAKEEYIAQVKQYLEAAWNFQTNTYGKPPGTPVDKMYVFIRNLAPDNNYGVTYWDSPPIIFLDNNFEDGCYMFTGENGLKITCAHEFFHCIQQVNYFLTQESYADSIKNPFLSEGTAKWMEEKEFDLDSYLEWADVLLNDMKTPIEQHSYESVFFWIFLEQKYQGIIKTVLESFRDNGNTSIIDAIESALNDPSGDKLKTLYKEFALACYVKTGQYGFNDPSMSLLPPVTLEPDYGNGIDDYYVNIFDQVSDTIDPAKIHSDHLTTKYIPINQPATLENTTKISIKVNGKTDKDWGVWAIKILNNDDIQPEEIQIDTKNFKGSKVFNNFGGEGATNIKSIVLQTSRLSKGSDYSPFEYSVKVTPNFTAICEPPSLHIPKGSNPQTHRIIITNSSVSSTVRYQITVTPINATPGWVVSAPSQDYIEIPPQSQGNVTFTVRNVSAVLPIELAIYVTRISPRREKHKLYSFLCRQRKE